MSLAIDHTLYCDRPGCRAELHLTGTHTAAAARTVAYRDHGWSTRSGDRCPSHNTRKDGRP
ncbi:hypothetical protein H1V43_32435 [Streptomyces sp. PSKA54]|uniref:Uncharacterized protein n=1 Tax=Streptomyces himalayensis subsp. aureolus TaxID=2758039 RepID=A0A7W2D7I3_9ACTN|nr:hypothetical protein [Streptomyces himalayensis]MBA4865972.1 hypothetical protein [Streptomyces himalayensis subsp. aureolus]